MPTGWLFPPNSGGEESGLNDAGIQFFRSSDALARETIQNSGDAAISPASDPVRVVFERKLISLKEIPGADQLHKVISQCREYMLGACKDAEQRIQNGEEFFQRALSLLSNRTLPVLRIGDYGTTGLEGNDQEAMSPWYRLIRKQGTSSMHGAGGGTYGIGQRAPFAFSALRTVFYSTVSRKQERGLIGKSILCTFKDDRNELRRPVGYWGLTGEAAEGVLRVSNPSMMPGCFRRDTVGTDLHILGYVQDDWRDDVVRSVLHHFFAAIEGGRLEVEVREEGKDPIRIGAGNLGDLVQEEYSRRKQTAASASEREENDATLGVTRHWLRALREPHGGAPSTRVLDRLGEVKLYLTLADDAPQRVVFMRRPRILVFHRRIKLLKGYAAVFVCETEEGNKILAQLEDPSHKQWDTSRMPGGDKILREINAFVRESLQKVISADQEQAQDIPDLWRFLPEEAVETNRKGKGKEKQSGQVTMDETADPKPRPKKPSVVRRPPAPPPDVLVPVPNAADGEGEDVVPGAPPEGGGGGGAGEGPGGELPEGPVPGAGPGEAPAGPGDLLPALQAGLVSFRTFFDKEKSCVRLVLNTRRRGVGDISLTAVGEDSDYPITIQSARDEDTGAEVAISGGVIRDLILEKGVTRRLLLNLDGDQHVALSAEVRRGR